MKYKIQSGFTIVELLIVVVVIAILAAITIVSYNGITTQANTSAAQSTASTVIKKAELYASSSDGNGSYPANLTTLTGGSSEKSWSLPQGTATQVTTPASPSAATIYTALTGASANTPKHVVIEPCGSNTGITVWYVDFTDKTAKSMTAGSGC